MTNLLLFSFGYLPLLAVFFLNLWARPHYQFFPLALAGAGFLAWVRLKELPRPLVPSRPLIGGLWLLASFAIVLVATILWSPWLGSLAVLAGLIGVIWLLGGRRLLRAMCPALILALVIVPPPLSLDSRFAEHLRLLAVNWSSQLLDLLEVTHARSGNIIELPGQKLLVEEACSGINSILITLAACLFYMLWRRASVIRILLSLSAAVSFVLLGNLLRIILGAWLRFRHGVDILSGWPHQIIGLVLFITYVGLIFSMERLLFFLTSPSRRQKTSAVAKPAVAVSPTQPIWRFSPTSVRVVACAFAITGVAEVARGWVAQRQAKAQPAIPQSALREGAIFSLPEQVGKWKRLDAESPRVQKVETMGVFSQVWHFQKGDIVASVALDYPFRGYHDVTVCYTMHGWNVLDQSVRETKLAKSTIAFSEVQMQNELGLHGVLWFSTVDETGHWLETPVLQRSMLDRWRKFSPRTDATTYRVQALVTSYSSLLPAEQQQVVNFFEEARSLLWQQLSTQMRGQP